MTKEEIELEEQERFVQSGTDEGEYEDAEWTEEEALRMDCLFCEYQSIEYQEISDHMTNEHGFNLQEIRRDNNLDFYDTIKLINYLRLNKNPAGSSSTLENIKAIIETCRQSEIYLKPTKENDALLYEFDSPF